MTGSGRRGSGSLRVTTSQYVDCRATREGKYRSVTVTRILRVRRHRRRRLRWRLSVRSCSCSRVGLLRLVLHGVLGVLSLCLSSHAGRKRGGTGRERGRRLVRSGVGGLLVEGRRRCLVCRVVGTLHLGRLRRGRRLKKERMGRGGERRGGGRGMRCPQCCSIRATSGGLEKGKGEGEESEMEEGNLKGKLVIETTQSTVLPTPATLLDCLNSVQNTDGAM